MLFQLENGKALAPESRIEGAGESAALVISGNYGLGAKFTEMTGWRKKLLHLDSIGLLKVEQKGRDFYVSRGRRLTPKRK